MRRKHVPEWMASHHGGPLNQYVCVECCATLPFPPSNDTRIVDAATLRGLRGWYSIVGRPMSPAIVMAFHEMRLAATLNTIGRLWEPGQGREDSIRVAVDDALDDLERER